MNIESANSKKVKKMQSLRILTVPRLLSINAVVAGLEIAACVAFTFIPPLLLKVNTFSAFPGHFQKPFYVILLAPSGALVFIMG